MKRNKIVIISGVLAFVVGMVFFAFCMYYNNINIQSIVKSIFAMIFAALFIMVIIIYPVICAGKKEKLVERIFKIEIINENNNLEHIRITEDNLLLKYKHVIKYWYVYPRIFTKIFFENISKRNEIPTYKIEKNIQLSEEEVDNIIILLKELDENINSKTILNYKGNKKHINNNDCNKIFEKYGIQI